MWISQETIESVKRGHDLKAVVESHGVRLKKKGRNFVGLCPFHSEQTPSFTVNPKSGLYHCFGCLAGGDVIGFLCKKEGLGFKEVMEKLSGKKTLPALSQSAPPVKPAASKSSYLNRARLLNRVVSFYHQSFCEDQRGLAYLQARGITDKSILTDFKIGYSNGTLPNTIPEEGEIKEALQEIGILNISGNEMFYGCVLFPILDENQDCVGLYGRKVEEISKETWSDATAPSVTHLYLPGPRMGVFHFQAAKRSQAIILTESIIDALTLYTAGFKEVIPCYGVNGFTEEHLALLIRQQTREVYLCFDRDEAGVNGAARIAGQLREKGMTTYIMTLPAFDHPGEKVDVNSFFLKVPEAASLFEKLLQEANVRVAIRSDKLKKQEQKEYEKTETGFIVGYDTRRYEMRGIIREGVKLKATIKAHKPNSGEQATLRQNFHLDTMDLYSNRSRQLFAKACADLFPEKEEVIIEDLLRMIDLAESWKPEGKETAHIPKMTRTEEDEALAFLKEPDLFKRLLSDLETLGLIGEEANKLMGYLAAISRKLDEPLSVLIQSRSAAGKSTLQDALLMLVPPEEYVKYTRLTGQALFYKEEESLVHKLLAIEEEQGAKEASYSIRNMQSSKSLSIAATGKDAVTGKLKTEEYRVKGPVALMMTTTEVELDYETSNRFITLTIDESKAMTERILKKQRERETLEGLINRVETDRIMKVHQNAQRLLRPLAVVNPYASHLTFPSDSLRARRDHKKYLGIMKAIAYLHQYQREIKTLTCQNESISYIEVTLEDIEKANQLAGEILGRTLDELSAPSRLLLSMIREMVQSRCQTEKIDPKEVRFSRKEIREWSRWSDFQVKCHIKQLEEMECLYSVTGKKGKEYIYELIYLGGGEDGKPFLTGLIPVAQLKQKLESDKTPKPGGTKSLLGGNLEGSWRPPGDKG